MPDPWKLGPADITALGPQRLVELLHLLVQREASANSIVGARIDTTLSITIPDGGLDSIVGWDGHAESTSYFPSRLIGFQSKAGHQTPTAMATDVLTRDRSDVKSQVRALVERGGTYIVFYGHDMAAELLGQAKEAIEAAIAEKIPRSAPTAMVYEASKIAAWATSHPGIFVWVAGLTGHPLPFSAQTYTEWANEPAHQRSYISNERIRGIIQELRHILSQPGRIARIDGLPGLGKSRLAIETLATLSDSGNIVYVDSAFERNGERIIESLQYWKRNSSTGIVVVDNCSDTLHNKITTIIAGSRLNALTIDYNLDEMGLAPVVRLPRSEDEIISGILRDSYGDRLPPADLARIVAFAFGSPRMAVLLAHAHLDRLERPIHSVTDDDLMGRLLFGREEPNRSHEMVIRALSLFEHVGASAEVAEHLEYVRAHFCPDISAAAFADAVGWFKERGILVEVGDYFRVSPPPMAVRLAKLWLDRSSAQMREAMFREDMPPRLVEMLCRQFSHLGTVPRAIEIASELCRHDGPFGKAEVLKTRRGARIFRSLAEVNPGAATAALMREFGAMSLSDLQRVVDARRDLVYSLEMLTFHAELFLTAGHVLARFAEAENERIANNATGTLTSKFAVWLGGTEAGPQHRLQLLDHLLAASDGAASLALECIAVGLQPDRHAARTVGPEYQGGRAALQDWQPHTKDELDNYIDGLLDRIIVASERGLRSRAQRVFADSLRSIIRLGCVGRLREIAAKIGGDLHPWTAASNAVRDSLKYDVPDGDSRRTAVEDLAELLSPATISERITALVSNAIADFEEVKGRGLVDRNEDRIASLAHDILQAGVLHEAVVQVSSGEQRLAFALGGHLAAQVGNEAMLTDIALTALRQVREEHPNPALLGGVLLELNRRNVPLKERALKIVASTDELKGFLPWLTAASKPADSDIERLIEQIETGQIAPAALQPLAYGQALSQVSDDTVKRLVWLIAEHNGQEVALAIIHMRVYASPEKWFEFQEIVRRILLSWDFVANPAPSFEDESIMSDLRRLLTERHDIELAMSVAQQVLSYVLRDVDFKSRSRAAALWPILLEHYPDETWPMIAEAFDSAAPLERMHLMFSFEYVPPGKTQREFVLLRLPKDVLLSWAASRPDYVPAYLAQHVSLYMMEDGRPVITPLAQELIGTFGERDDVRNQVYANLSSFLSVGSRVPYYEERIAFLKDLPDFGMAEVVQWRSEMIDVFSQMRDEARKRDEEFRGGIF